MVKPQLNLDKKDDLKKPDGNLVKVVTIGEEPAPLNPEPIYAPPTPRRRGRACRCLCLSLILIAFFLFTFVCVGYFLRSRSVGWCGVGYNDDYDYYNYYDNYSPDYYGSYDASWKMPYGDDMLFAPRPTGPPLQRFLEERLDINLDLRIIRINRDDDIFPGVSVLHDFNLNMSAYLLPSSDVCYIRPMEMQSILSPEEFQNFLETEAYKDQDFPMRSEVYTVNPESVTNVGEHIEGLCSSYNSYFINSIPTEQWPTFWKNARQVLRDHVGDRDDSSEEEGRGHHGGRRHHGGRHPHGGRHDSSEGHDSSSEEEGHGRRQRRFVRMREYIDNVRSFDGQQVVDMHIFQTHRLDGLTPEGLGKLTDMLEEEAEEDDFIP